MSQLHIRNIFQLILPVQERSQNLQLVPGLLTSGDEFGFAVIDSISKATYEYKVYLYSLKGGEYQRTVPNCLCWAKRNPISFQTVGIIMRLKVQHGFFDFRKLDCGRNILLVVACFHEGTLLRQASSNILKLLPKKRTGKSDAEGT